MLAVNQTCWSEAEPPLASVAPGVNATWTQTRNAISCCSNHIQHYVSD